MEKCKSEQKVTIHGVPLDPCNYEEVAVYRNVTVRVLKCKDCGHIEIEWERQADTESSVKGAIE